MKKILNICFSDLSRDPRVYRQIQFLKENSNFKIFCAGFCHPNTEGIEYIDIKYQKKDLVKKLIYASKLKLRMYENCYWSDVHIKDAWNKLKHKKFDLIISNDLNTLPLTVKLSQKYGGNCQRIALESSNLFTESHSEDLIALDEALTKFAAEDPERADIVKLCYFGGLSIEQAARVLEISRATAYRYWSYARAWLYDEIKKG